MGETLLMSIYFLPISAHLVGNSCNPAEVPRHLRICNVGVIH